MHSSRPISAGLSRPPAATPAPHMPFRRYTPRPGDADWQRLAREAHELSTRLRGQLERPKQGISQWRRRLASWQTAAHNYFENRQRSKAKREDLLPLYFIWTTLRPCNFLCTYCDDHQGARYPELDGRGKLDTAAGIRLLEVMRTRTPSVYFAGGEPTLRKDLPALVRAARDLDYFPIVVNTNGSLFHRLLDKALWRGFLADVDILVVSLDALNLETLAQMWGTKQPEDVLRNVLVLRELSQEMGFKLMVNTVMQPEHMGEARAVLDWADDLGIWFCPVPMNRGPAVDQRVLNDADYSALVDTILKRKRAGGRIAGSLRMNQRLLSAAPLNCRNTLKPHIDHDGSLIWPCKASVNVKPASLKVLDFADVDALYAHACTLVNPTGFHGPATNQCGANCNWAQNYTTDEYAHGLAHPLSLLGGVADFLRR